MWLCSQLWCPQQSQWWLKQNQSVHPGAAACTMARLPLRGLVVTRQCGCRRGWGRGARCALQWLCPQGHTLWWLSPEGHTLQLLSPEGHTLPWLSPEGHTLPGLSPEGHFPADSTLVPGSAVLLGLPLTKNGPGKENLSAGLALSQAFRWKCLARVPQIFDSWSLLSLLAGAAVPKADMKL